MRKVRLLIAVLSFAAANAKAQGVTVADKATLPDGREKIKGDTMLANGKILTVYSFEKYRNEEDHIYKLVVIGEDQSGKRIKENISRMIPKGASGLRPDLSNGYLASNGIRYSVGDTVRFGRGSGMNGKFVFLTMGGWYAVASYNQSKGTEQFNSNAQYAGLSGIIKKIKSYRVLGVDRVIFVLNVGNITNFDLSINEAIMACEVIPCTTNATQPAIQQAPLSVADELTKLKKLKDEGVLTDEEFTAQKAKLLAK